MSLVFNTPQIEENNRITAFWRNDADIDKIVDHTDENLDSDEEENIDGTEEMSIQKIETDSRMLSRQKHRKHKI